MSHPSSGFETTQRFTRRLNRRYGLTGKTLYVRKADWVSRDGSGASYTGKTHEIVVGA